MMELKDILKTEEGYNRRGYHKSDGLSYFKGLLI